MNRFFELFLVGVLFVIQLSIWSLLIFFLLLPYLGFFIFPEISALSQLIVRLPEPRFTLATIFLMGGFGSLLAFATNRYSFPGFLRYTFFIRGVFITCAYLLAHFFWKSFSIVNFIPVLGPLLVFCGFLFFLPLFYEYIMNFLTAIYDIYNKRLIYVLSKRDFLYIIIQLLLLTNLFLLLNRYVFPEVYKFEKNEERIKNRASLNPYISKVEPRIAYHGTFVVLRGHNFELNSGKKSKLMSSGGELNTSVWTGTKVIFQIPLHLRVGDIKVWIEKPQVWDGRKILTKSNFIIMKLISRTDGWDEYDDAYFEQLKYLDKETLQLNSYVEK